MYEKTGDKRKKTLYVALTTELLVQRRTRLDLRQQPCELKGEVALPYNPCLYER